MSYAEYGPLLPTVELPALAADVGEQILCWDDVMYQWTLEETRGLLEKQNPPFSALATNILTKFISGRAILENRNGWETPTNRPDVSLTNCAASYWQYLFQEQGRLWLGNYEQLRSLDGSPVLWKRAPSPLRNLSDWERDNLEDVTQDDQYLPLDHEVFAFDIVLAQWVKVAFSSKEEYRERYWCWAEIVEPIESEEDELEDDELEEDEDGEDYPSLGEERDGRILVAHGDDFLSEMVPWVERFQSRLKLVLEKMDENDDNVPWIDIGVDDGFILLEFLERIGAEVETEHWTGMMISGVYKFCWVPADEVDQIIQRGEALLAELEALTEDDDEEE